MHPKFANSILTAQPNEMDASVTPEGVIEGYASTYNAAPDAQSDVVLPGAFTTALKDAQSGNFPVMLWSHRMEEPIGRWTGMEDTPKGLFVRGQLNLKTVKGREAFEHVKAGDANGLSVGYLTPENGREYVGQGTFHLKSVDLKEISIVTIPSNPAARISGVKMLKSKADAIDLLRSAGLSRKAAARFASGGFPALSDGTFDEKQIHQLAARIEAATNEMRQK